MFGTVDKHQYFKSFISEATSVRLEYWSNNAENSLLIISKLMAISSN